MYFLKEDKMTTSLCRTSRILYMYFVISYTLNMHTYTTSFFFNCKWILVTIFHISLKKSCDLRVSASEMKLLNPTNIILTYTVDSISCIIYLAGTINFCCIFTLKNKNPSTSSVFFLLVQILVFAFSSNDKSTLYLFNF